MRRWLVREAAELEQYGLLRMVRDPLAVSGQTEVTAKGELKSIGLNERAQWARLLAAAYKEAFKRDGIRVRVSVGKSALWRDVGEQERGGEVAASGKVCVQSSSDGRLGEGAAEPS